MAVGHDASKVEVTPQDWAAEQSPAKIVGCDTRNGPRPCSKIDAGKPLPYVSFGDSDAAQIGDWVVAVGNPFGLGVQGDDRHHLGRGPRLHPHYRRSSTTSTDRRADQPRQFRRILTCPDLELRCQAVGINTTIYSPNGGMRRDRMCAVRPTSRRKSSPRLEEQRQGNRSAAGLGVQIQPVTPAIASSLGLKNDHGALVAVVTPDSPGAAAGLKQGDVILGFDGKDITKFSARSLPTVVAAQKCRAQRRH